MMLRSRSRNNVNQDEKASLPVTLKSQQNSNGSSAKSFSLSENPSRTLQQAYMKIADRQKNIRERMQQYNTRTANSTYNSLSQLSAEDQEQQEQKLNAMVQRLPLCTIVTYQPEMKQVSRRLLPSVS